MKHLIKHIALIIFVLPSIVLADGVKLDDLFERKGLYYKKFTNVPYSGSIIGREQGIMKNGERDGPWAEYNKNGQLYRKGTYREGIFVGPYTSYHENGQLHRKGTYKKNYTANDLAELKDVIEEIEAMVSSKDTVDYIGFRGTPVGPWVEYHPNGQLESETTYDEEGMQVDGPYVKYRTNGKVSENGIYKNANREYLFVKYYDNGQVAEKGKLEKGSLVGLWVSYYSNAQLKSKGRWKWKSNFSVRDGPWVFYNSHGTKRFEPQGRKSLGRWGDEGSGTYRDGKKISD